MKKSLSFLVAVALVFGLFASMASAADAGLTTEQKYQQFVDQKILKGDPSGDARLSANLTRAEFVTIADAINGLAEVTTTQTFSDVTKGQWFHGAIEAAAKAGLVNGIGQGKFGPKLNVTVEQAIKVFVISAGLKPVDGATVDGASVWAAPYIKAAQDAGFPVPANFKADATRGQAIDLAYAASVAKAVPTLSDVKAVANADDTITVTGKVVGTADSVKVALGTADAVAATLKDDGTFTYTTAAQTAGTYTLSVVAYDGAKASAASTVSATIDAFAVKSVAVSGSNKVVVTFNKPVSKTSALASGHYALTGTSLPVGLAIDQVYVSDDLLTVTVAYNQSFAADAYGQFAIDNTLLSSANKTLAAYKQPLYLNDTTAPTVTGVTWSGTQAKVSFSEPVQAGYVVSIDGVNSVSTSYTVAPATDDQGQIVGVTINGWDKASTHTIDIVGYQDLANNFGTDYNTNVTVPNDDAAPVVTSVSVNGAVVTISFSEALADQGGSVYGMVYSNSYPSGTPITNFDTTNNTATVDLGADLIAAGNVSFLTETIKIGSFVDLANNPSSATPTSKTVTLTLDSSDPVFQSAFIADGNNDGVNDIIAKFNESVTGADISSATAVYTDTNGVVHSTPVSFTVIDGYDDDNDAALESNYLVLDPGTALVAGAKYKVTLAGNGTTTGVADLSPTPNFAGNITFTVTANSTSNQGTLGFAGVTYPVVQSTSNPSVIDLYLNAEITAAQLTNNNFLINGKVLPSGSTIQFVDDRTHVQITLASGAIPATGTRTVSLANLVDVSGNTLNSSNNSAPVALTENVAPKAVSAKLLSDRQIQVTFSEPVTPNTVGGVEVWINNTKYTTTAFTWQSTSSANVWVLDFGTTSVFTTGQTIQVKLSGADIQDANNNYAADGNVTVSLS